MLMLINYYYVNFFILAFEWLGLCLIFIVLSIIQIIKLIKERNNLSSVRIQKTVVFTTLFVLTFFRVSDKLIEKVDWLIFFNRRQQIVEQVANRQLNPNVSWNGWVCELPYRFPIVSNGGNQIGIYRDTTKGTVAITFWIFRNFFESPSTQFVYTNDSEEIKWIEDKIRRSPSDNWKLRENWYRTTGD